MTGGPVVHVIAPSPAGGAESVVIALAAADPAHTRVIILNQVAAADAPAHPVTEQLRRRGVTVHEVRCGRRQYAAEARESERLLRDMGASVVHTHGYHGTWVGYRAARPLGVRTVATVHGYLTRSLRERIYNAIDRRLLRRFDAVIAVSPGIESQLLRSGLDRSRVHFVQNGMTTVAPEGDRGGMRRDLGLGSAERIVAWVGRLSPEKGADLFLRALALCGADARALVVGEGPERPALEQLAHELGLHHKNRVRFLGFRADASSLLPAVDVLALTSRMEGTPMVILEAVAAGVPIVAFRVGGIPDLLDERSAWLVPPEDVDALAASLRQAIASPADGRQRAEAARRLLGDRLSLESWLAKVRKVYELAHRTS